ncbi:SCO6880 family protein [Nonomuraea ceibae]|uniref:SCO6880 family protein n=1 Tax=Nonomuraea ceibae TaxID=1935170 RepID=UPI001C5FFE99|nr:SCO6880 family protein [Nonomuraea ceibae]
MTSTTTDLHTYGGWRRSRSLGLGSLDTRQTIMLLSAMLAPLLAGLLIGVRAAMLLAPAAVVVALLSVARRGGALVLDAGLAWVRWRWADWRTHTVALGQMVTPMPQRWDLPGVLAPTRLLDVEDPGRGRIGVVWNQRSGHMTATLLLSPAGALLADPATVNRQISNWGHLLASLADDTAIQHAAVTIELVPEPGTQLVDHVQGRLSPSAPQLAQQVIGELTAMAPRASAQVRARLSLTCDPSLGASSPREVPQAVAEVLRSLGGLTVSAAGAEVLRRASATDLIRIVRTAYDVDAEPVSAGWEKLRWADARPEHARDRYDHYQHDGSCSLSWVLLEAPRQRVSHDVLVSLLSPGQYRRRVTLTYRTLPRDVAGALLEQEVNAAAVREEYKRRTRRDPTARDRADASRAARAAIEEAHGAGLVQWSLYVTTTAPSRAELAQARREVEQAAGHARLKLRLAYGGQAAAFAVGLPCGVYPDEA